MTAFASLMRRADTLRRLESNPARAEWWVGYIRGLRRAHHGERFGSQAEHDMWLAASESDDPMRAALGHGYRAGLTLESREPREYLTEDGIVLYPTGDDDDAGRRVSVAAAR